MIDKINEKNLLTTIKAIFLFTITTLVFINTFVLAYLVPIVGFHLIPENQAAAELWEVVNLVMGGCLAILIVCAFVYGTVKLVKRL